MAEKIGEQLKSLRERFGFSQSALCAATGLGQSQLSRYERGAVSPSWDQVERILDGLGATVVDLFADQIDTNSESTFWYAFWNHPPATFEETADPKNATEIFHFRKNSPVVKLIDLAPVDGRYAVIRAIGDAMVPDWYPGDLLIIDQSVKPTMRQVVIGYLDGKAAIRRLVGRGDQKLLVASNRGYSPVLFDSDRWQHIGVVIYAVRNLRSNFFASQLNRVLDTINGSTE